MSGLLDRMRRCLTLTRGGQVMVIAASIVAVGACSQGDMEATDIGDHVNESISGAEGADLKASAQNLADSDVVTGRTYIRQHLGHMLSAMYVGAGASEADECKRLEGKTMTRFPYVMSYTGCVSDLSRAYERCAAKPGNTNWSRCIGNEIGIDLPASASSVDDIVDVYREQLASYLYGNQLAKSPQYGTTFCGSNSYCEDQVRSGYKYCLHSTKLPDYSDSTLYFDRAFRDIPWSLCMGNILMAPPTYGGDTSQCSVPDFESELWTDPDKAPQAWKDLRVGAYNDGHPEIESLSHGNNCYNYALNVTGRPASDGALYFGEPGKSMPGRDPISFDLHELLLYDGLVEVGRFAQCPSRLTKIAAFTGVSAIGYTYHFSRQGPDGRWSEKMSDSVRDEPMLRREGFEFTHILGRPGGSRGSYNGVRYYCVCSSAEQGMGPAPINDRLFPL